MNWQPSERFAEWPGCFSCVHYGYAKSAAYPKAIPLPILSSKVDHMVPRPGQVDEIVFEPMDAEVWQRTGQRVPLRTPPPAD